MIRPAQRKLLERARAAAAPEPAAFAELLRRHGGADRVEDLTAAGLARLLDHCTVLGFRDRRRPILSDWTRRLIEEARLQIGLSDFAFATDLRCHSGVTDLRDLDGRHLVELLARWEPCGLSVAAFIAARRAITPAQLRLVQLARTRVEMADDRYYRVLRDFGGVVSASDLDRRGLDLVMAFLEEEGFERQPIAHAQPAFGRRPGFASPEQVELIRTLWREWTGPTAESEAAVEGALNAWLERYHHVSSLRFLTTGIAAKAITALKAMKARKAAATRREAEHA